MAEEASWLVVGLGNPGPKYAGHRHNVGFTVVEQWFLDREGPYAAPWREKFHGLLASTSSTSPRTFVLKPQTYMNRSGQSVAAAANFHHVPPQRMIVVHDELDFEFGRIAIKLGGGHGGHNGLRDIIAQLGSADFVRIRTGIGRPPPGRTEVSSWVLSDFSASERAEMPDLVALASRAISAILEQGPAAAMNEINARREQSPGSGNPS